MNNLEAIKVFMGDKTNKVLSDNEYKDFLELNGINSDDEYSPEYKSNLMLIKAEILEVIYSNPVLFSKYQEGDIVKDYQKENMLTVIKNIRLQYKKVV